MEKQFKKILIAGGSGYVGSSLSSFLQNAGYDVAILSRSKPLVSKAKTFFWNPGKNEIDEEALTWPDVIINLSGQNVGAKRWTKSRKEELLTSRLIPTSFLVERINRGDFPNVGLLMNASAVGFYPEGVHPLTEDSKPGNSFQAGLVDGWETEARRLNKAGVRLVIPRIGVVLSRNSEALKKMALPIKMGVGSPLGSGRQLVPWIHLTDLCRAFLFVIDNGNASGPINFAHPQLLSNRELTEAIARSLRRPIFLPNVPAFVLRTVLGEMATIVLASIATSSQKILDLGYSFEFPDIDSALADQN